MITPELVQATVDQRRHELERARRELEAQGKLQGQAAPPRRGLSLPALRLPFSFVPQRLRRATSTG